MPMNFISSGLQAIRNLKLQNGEFLLIEEIPSSSPGRADAPPRHILVKIRLNPVISRRFRKAATPTGGMEISRTGMPGWRLKRRTSTPGQQ